MSMTMKNYSEKRDFHRMTVDSPVQITDSQGEKLSGICRDLSGTGMQIEVERAFREGEEIQILLPSSNEQFPPLETISKVVRCEPAGDVYLLGTAIVTVER